MQIFLITALIAFFGAGCSDKAPKAQAGLPEVAVRTGRVLRKTVPVTVEVVGTVEAYNSVPVLPRVTGQILSSHFKEGQAVAAGDRLFTIDAAPFEQKLKEAAGQLAMNQAKLKFSKAQAERFIFLLERGAVSRSECDKNQSEAVQLEQTVEADKAALEQARLNLSYCEVRAPVSGRAGGYLADKGSVVEAFRTRLVLVNQIQPVKVVFSVSEKYLPDIKKLMSARAGAVSVAIPGTPSKSSGGMISFLDNAIDQATGMVRLKAEFPNRDTLLWPGQFVRVEVLLSNLSDAVVAPAEAVQANQNGNYVFVVKPDKTVELRNVILERTCGTLAVISQGIAPGELVVTDGQNKLKSGRKVTLVGTAQAEDGVLQTVKLP
jgi:multidrug efflux system membrane fusion protein